MITSMNHAVTDAERLRPRAKSSAKRLREKGIAKNRKRLHDLPESADIPLWAFRKNARWPYEIRLRWPVMVNDELTIIL